ncbi:MAG: glycosyltransferase [Thermotogae bacterium]|nr:glycosyltransferase [Thermotogota bacterium]
MKVMVLTALYGSGHRIAARGLVDALEYLGIDHDHRRINFSVLDIVEEGGFAEKASSKAYEFLMRRGHGVWKLLYNSRVLTTGPFRRLYRMQVKNFVKYLERYSPNAVISTHFLTSLIGIIYKERSGTPIFTVITDFAAHPLWIWEGTNRYYVALDTTTKDPLLEGADVRVTGIPLRKGFWNPPSKEEARRELNYPLWRTVVLISAGSYASVDVEPLVKKLKEYGVFVVLLAGKRRDAYRRFLTLFKELKVDGVVYPFIDFVPKVMAASDLFITKAGGVSVAEALSVGLPMIFVNNMPGQEELNARIVESKGAAINSKTPGRALKDLEDLLSDTKKLRLMGERAKKLGRPKASLKIVSDILGYADGI